MLRVSASSRTIEVSPVALRQVSGFASALDVTWRGAVVTFDGSATSAPIYTLQRATPSGLWLLVEYLPTVIVSSEYDEDWWREHGQGE